MMHVLYRLKVYFVLFLFSCAQFSARSFAAENTGVDINDVSLLFPEPQTEEELSVMLKADTVLKNGQQVLPEQILQDVLKSVVLRKNEQVSNAVILEDSGEISRQIALPGSGLRSQVVAGPPVSLADLSRWAVVSLRFDYGFPGDFVPETERSVQLRLVLQPVADLRNSGFAADASLHLLYSFASGSNPSEYVQAKRIVANAILRLKNESDRSGISTAGKGLGVHPVLKAQGLLGDFNKVAKKEITELLLMGKLKTVAVMIADNGVIPWFFFSGIVHDGRYLPLAQRFNETNSLFESFLEALPAAKSSGTASPEFTNGRPQTNDYLTLFQSPQPILDAKGVQSLGLIQDPHFGGQQPNRPDLQNHLSCSTCHTATARQIEISPAEIVVPELLGFTPENKPSNFISQGSIQDQLWNVRNFGYFVRRPSIALRTLYESQLVAAETNRILGLSVKGTQCAKPAEYISCLGTQLNQAPGTQNCFASACK